MLWSPLNSRQVRFGRVHTLPLLGAPAARRALTQRSSLSWSLLRYLGQGMSVLASAGVCMACDLSGAASVVGVPRGLLTAGAGSVFACMSKDYGQPAWVCGAPCLTSVVSKVKLLPRATLSLAELRAEL